MKSAAATIVFATAALAAPQFGNGFNNFNPNPWNGGNNGVNPNYRVTCNCQSNGQIMPWLGQQACNSLGTIWGNLQPDQNGNCYDTNGFGLDPDGFEAACQRVANNQGPGWQPDWWGNNGNNNPFQPQAIRGVCTPF